MATPVSLIHYTEFRTVARHRDLRCATVKLNVLQWCDKKIRNLKNHVYCSKYGATKAALVAKRTKLEACKKPFVFARQILRGALQEGISILLPCEALPPMDCMTRNVNFFRRKHYPQGPKRQEKEFNLNYTHLPFDFLLEDISLDGERHILFATTTQLRLLGVHKNLVCGRNFEISAHVLRPIVLNSCICA